MLFFGGQSLKNEAYSYRNKYDSRGAKFCFRVKPIQKGRKYENVSCFPWKCTHLSYMILIPRREKKFSLQEMIKTFLLEWWPFEKGRQIFQLDITNQALPLLCCFWSRIINLVSKDTNMIFYILPMWCWYCGYSMVNPLYNDICYYSKIHYNVNLVCIKISGLCIFSLIFPFYSSGKHVLCIC